MLDEREISYGHACSFFERLDPHCWARGLHGRVEEGRSAGGISYGYRAKREHVVVTDLASALQAIDNIVEQGEGAPGHAEDSHFARFVAVRREYEALLAEDPGFVPSRAVARNPVMRRPPHPEGRVFVEDPGAAAILDLGNALYNMMLRCLVQAYGRSDGDSGAKAALVDAAVTIMGSVTRLGQVLTTKPAGPGHPGVQGRLDLRHLAQPAAAD